MTNKQFLQAKELALALLHQDKAKELACHVQFVVMVGLELAQKYNVDTKIIELSCLLHDVGRSHEIEDEDHGDSGARITADLLRDVGIPKKEFTTILECIQKHTKNLPSYTIEQKIVITADGASKVLYHEAFMLLCKKQTYHEKLEWGKKYLEKGYKRTLMPEYKKTLVNKYKSIKTTYASISSPVEA